MKYRHELKHIINTADFLALTSKLGFIAEPDEHMKNGAYFVRSLYFDNYSDKVMRDKIDGLSVREKFRIRFYDMDDSFIRLEKKSKLHGLCMKQSAVLNREQTERIIGGDTDFLAEEKDPLLNEFYAKLTSLCLRPKSIVDYTRQAYVYPYGNVRITFDYGIRSVNSAEDFFTRESADVPVTNTVIMEVKYDDFLPQIIADITCLEGRQSESFSKYAAARYI
ncbi:MAG: polyphosphate polymerase domain-containing protein [Oscillospiraceae bacterium]|nr:polyphosphate polymerase domain-containing protein [Oscillospiraceae bacterium]